MALTDSACRTAKGSERPYKLSDSGGLQLWVHTSGSRTWRQAYRFRGKQKNVSLGVYPEMSLAEARSRREDCKRMIRDGLDPAVGIKRPSKSAVAASRQFQNVAKLWFDTVKASWILDHQDRVWKRLSRDAFPLLGDKDIGEITPPDVLAVIRAVEARDALDVARRVRQSISATFKFAIAEGWVRTNPASELDAALKPKPKIVHLSSLREKDLPEFFRKLSEYDGHVATHHAILFTIQTMVRTNETRFAKWSEFEDLESDKPIWRIPANRMKMKREHIVPLAAQTVTLVRDLHRYSGTYIHVFPAPSKKGVMSENTMLYALYRMGFHSRATIHGFRTTASTMLNERGWNKDWVEKQLAHDAEDKVRAAYNAAEYLTGRREMMQWWNDQLTIHASTKNFTVASSSNHFSI